MNVLVAAGLNETSESIDFCDFNGVQNCNSIGVKEFLASVL
jgi:hypothetical protein